MGVAIIVMPDQADNLRQLRFVAALPLAPEFVSGPPIVLVTGGRPGVGATTVAVNLAAVLGDAGKRVLVVDAAPEQGKLTEIARAKQSKADRSLADVLAGQCSAVEAITEGPAGTMLLGTSGHVRRGGRGIESRRDSSTVTKVKYSRDEQQRLLAELQSLREKFDLVVIDVGSEQGPWTRRFWLRAQLVLLVTTTDSSALLDTYAAMKRSLADGMGPEVRIIINQCDDERVASDVHGRLADSCLRFLGHSIPAVPSLPRHIDRAGNDRLPRVWESPNSSFGHAMLWLGRSVSDVLSTVASDVRAEAA